jgi:deazaflavin-dependent oxidoreductase (nitroreductase family)
MMVARAPGEVFDFLADPRNEPAYNPLILSARKVTPGAIGPGTRFVQIAKSFGRVGELTIDLVDYQRPHHLSWAIASNGLDVRGDEHLYADGDGTFVNWVWQLRPRGPVRLLGPLLGFAGRRLEQRVWDDMKCYLESVQHLPSTDEDEESRSTVGGLRPGINNQAAPSSLPDRAPDVVGPMGWEGFRIRLEHAVDTRSVRFGVWLYRRTRGRAPHLWRRRALVLTTTGRRSGLPRTVIVQFFPDGSDLVVVAANSGLPRHPAWYLNLQAHPRVRVELEGETFVARAEPMTPEEATAHWPRVLEVAPDYERYRRRTTRVIPLIRLVRDS